MAYSLLDGLREANKTVSESTDRKYKRRNDTMDYLAKKAATADIGWDVSQDGQDIVERPDFMSKRQAEARKFDAEARQIENELQIQEQMKNGTMSPLGVPGPISTASQPLGGGDQPFTMVAGTKGALKSVKNPNYLNPAQKVQMEKVQMDIDAKKAADLNKAEGLRDSAEAALKTIGEVRKGSKYFGGLAAELPSWLAPSSIPKPLGGAGEYGQRAEWEANINNLLSKRVVDLMNEMKQASRTGATGFGQLNRSELELLKNASTALNKRLPPEIAEKYLNQIEGLYQKVLGGKSSGVPSFATEQEAEASGYKGEALIGGKQARIE